MKIDRLIGILRILAKRESLSERYRGLVAVSDRVKRLKE